LPIVLQQPETTPFATMLQFSLHLSLVYNRQRESSATVLTFVSWCLLFLHQLVRFPFHKYSEARASLRYVHIILYPYIYIRHPSPNLKPDSQTFHTDQASSAATRHLQSLTLLADSCRVTRGLTLISPYLTLGARNSCFSPSALSLSSFERTRNNYQDLEVLCIGGVQCSVILYNIARRGSFLFLEPGTAPHNLRQLSIRPSLTHAPVLILLTVIHLRDDGG
jgi:hypothetical protein